MASFDSSHRATDMAGSGSAASGMSVGDFVTRVSANDVAATELISTGLFNEPFGLSVVEAMACGTPRTVNSPMQSSPISTG